MLKRGMRKTTTDISTHKNRPEPLVCLTAYTTPMASILDSHADLLLVGDSIGMVMYGMENTLGVDLEMMIRHGQAVMRGAAKSCVIVDMPYGTYENSPAQALESAARIMKETGCGGVKLEGGTDMATTIAHLVQNGIPVMGHIGLQPQSVIKDGGYKVKGRTAEQEEQLLNDAHAVEAAGAFSLVLEGTVEDVSTRITRNISIPVIGIGASAECDGQILVSEDMLGLSVGHIAKFVKQYSTLNKDVESAVQAYAADVRARKFPSSDHTYNRLQQSIQKLSKAS